MPGDAWRNGKGYIFGSEPLQFLCTSTCHSLYHYIPTYSTPLGCSSRKTLSDTTSQPLLAAFRTFSQSTTMSLSKLSTEIDEIIIQNLPQHARHSLTLTSKSYHKVTNPYLYRNIRVRESDALSVARLLLSLLGHKDLQQYIQSFDLISASKRRAIDAPYLGNDDPNVKARPKTIENINQELLGKSSHIWKAIERFSYHLGDLTFARNWYF